jgi:hypothetical protein
LILGIYGKVIVASVAIIVTWTSTTTAAEHRLAGRWGNTSNAVGIIQSGQTVFVFSKNGWSLGRLQPRTAGGFATGQGAWTLDAKAEPATVSVGVRNNHLYILVAPAGVGGSSEIKMILEPVAVETATEGMSGIGPIADVQPVTPPCNPGEGLKLCSRSATKDRLVRWDAPHVF